MIEVDNLVYEYPTKRALDGVSLNVRRQTITALVGPNGAGKTTLMRCLATLDAPYGGTIPLPGATRATARAPSMNNWAICRISSDFMTRSVFGNA